MAKEIRLPRFGDTMEEGTIVNCKVHVGDHVKRGDIIFEIETDKATVELESPADGYVKRVLATVGQTCRVGTPLLILGEKDEQIGDEYVRSLKKEEGGRRTEDKRQNAEERMQKAKDKRKDNSKLKTQSSKLSIPVSRFHKLTAEKMLRSKQEIPCFYLTVRADVTELVAYRTKLNEAGPIKIAYSDFVIKAAASGLVRFPIMTGQLEGDSIRLADSIGVGVAIAVPEGLVAPIVKDADKKTLVEIARYSRMLADKARNPGAPGLMPEDLEGGCITVSNLGSFGIDSFIPIAVPGQCSILGIGRIKDVCVPDDHPDKIGVVIRKMMSITMSVDHKVANGAYASQFLDFVKKALENPANLK
jgi:pyruvate dehydrogenase E2 component (dihydrolipoamide acetyltransferase)